MRAMMVLALFAGMVAAGGGCSCGGLETAAPPPAALPAAETPVPAAVTDSSVARLFTPATTEQAAQELAAPGATGIPTLVQQLRAAKGNYTGMGYLRIIELLGGSRSPEAVTVICEVVNDRQAVHYSEVLPWTIDALQKLGDPRAVPALEGVLADPNVDRVVKVSAARALTTLTGRPYSVPAAAPLN